MEKINIKYWEELKSNSKVKSFVVETYFECWITIINAKSNCEFVQYVDLFCGKSKYDDGEDSTAIRVMKKILKNNNFSKKCKVFFNDKVSKNIKDLKNAIENLDSYNNLKYPPKYFNEEVSIKFIEKLGIDFSKPIFLFFDPFGYKGLSSNLLEYFLKGWGSDTILFFNYNRINPGVNNPHIIKHINCIFGEHGSEKLRNLFEKTEDSYKRMQYILEAFEDELQKKDIKYSVRLKFYIKNTNKVSHFIIGLTKNIRGYLTFKEVFSDATTKESDEKGFGSFEYRSQLTVENFLDNIHNKRKETLMNDLCEKYKGCEAVELQKIFDEHHINTNYYEISYKNAIKQLENDDKVEVLEEKSDKAKRRKGTHPLNIMVKFK